MFLIDTNVHSELRRADRANPNVLEWAKHQRFSDLYLSAITVMEIETGVLQLERHDRNQALLFRRWVERTLLDFSERILPISTIVALRCAALHVPDRRPDRDAFIAATALVHDLIVVTRNTRDFEGTGVKLLNPWKG
jgi:predicted nucleic acid-binding protein